MIFQITDGKITDGKIATQLAALRGLRTQLQGVWDQYNTKAEKAGVLTDSLRDTIGGLSGESATLRSYLESLGGSANASFGGYLKYIAEAKVGTVALKAETIALNTALSLGVSLLASFVFDKFIQAIRATAEARKAAIDSANEVQNLRTSLGGLVEQYKSLYSETGGAWDTTALASVKSIQQQITDLVGDQAEGINLVNGELKTQLALLGDISVKNSEVWLRDNAGAVQSSKKFLNADVSDYLGSFSGAAKQILNQNYEKYGFRNATETQRNREGFIYWIDGTRDEIIATYEQIYADLEAYAKGTGEDLTSELVRVSDKLRGLKTATYSEAHSTYDSWLQNEAIVSQADVLKNGFADQAAFDEYISGLRSATDGNKELRDAMIEVVKNAFPEFVQATSSAADGAEKQASGIDYLIEKYKKLKAENEELSKYSRIDLTNRPQVQMDDGSVATVLTTNGEYTVQRQDVIIHYTPILPDGEVLSEDAARRYIQALVDSSYPDTLLTQDARNKKLILKIDTDFDFTLSDEQKDKLWDAIGDAYDELSGVYAQGGLEGLTAKITDAMTSAGVPIEDAAKYLAALFDADQWDLDLHTAQEALYGMQYAAYGTGTSFEDLIGTSEMLQRVLAGMTIPEALEFLSNGNMGSAKNFTSYFDAAVEHFLLRVGQLLLELRK